MGDGVQVTNIKLIRTSCILVKKKKKCKEKKQQQLPLQWLFISFVSGNKGYVQSRIMSEI